LFAFYWYIVRFLLVYCSLLCSPGSIRFKGAGNPVKISGSAGSSGQVCLDTYRGYMAYHLEGNALKEVADIPWNLIQSMGSKVQAAYDFVAIF